MIEKTSIYVHSSDGPGVGGCETPGLTVRVGAVGVPAIIGGGSM